MKLVVVALVLAIMTSSCGRSAPAALSSAARLGAPSPSASPSPVAEEPAFSPYLPRPITVVAPERTSSSGPLGFSCRLPIYIVDSHAPPQSQVGFLSVPSGSVTLQPAPFLPAGSVRTANDTPEPLYPNAFYFDRAFSRWVPVGRGAVSPDGSHYAYLTFPEQNRGLMNIVDVSTGNVRTYPATYVYPIARYVVLNYAKDGIYLGVGYEGPIVGLWLMDPNTGAIRQLAVDWIQALEGTAAWVGTVNPADPNPAPAGLTALPDSVDRFDLVTNSQTPWLYLPGSVVDAVAVDLAGHPIVLVMHGFSNDAELLVLTGPGVAQQIFHGTSTELQSLLRDNFGSYQPGSLRSPIADSHGVWFGGPAGIYLYSPEVGMRKVSNQAGYPGNGCT